MPATAVVSTAAANASDTPIKPVFRFHRGDAQISMVTGGVGVSLARPAALLVATAPGGTHFIWGNCEAPTGFQ
jgi:hypothetical protein